MECVESGRRCEDVAPVHWRVHQAGLHRWRPGLSTDLQRPVRPDDIVRAAQEVDVPVELVGATGVAGRATAQVRRALANREVETLDERGVQGLGILRLPQRSLQPTRRADPRRWCADAGRPTRFKPSSPSPTDVVRRVLATHYRPAPHSGGPSWLTFLGHAKDSLWSIDLWVANYYSARNPLRLSSLVILGVVARMFRCATRSSCWCT